MVYLPGQDIARSLYMIAPPERLNVYSFEQGPIRPPSEARSLLIRATRNCPWNRCEFCDAYKGTKFELRDVQEIKKDIEMAKAIDDEIISAAWRLGYGGRVKEVAAMIYSNPLYSSCVRSIALRLYFGEGTAFLQDSNSLIMRTPELVEVLRFLKETFPTITRVTSYGRSHTASKKTVEELKEIYDAGLSRLHLGLETGYDPLLSYMQKGVTAKQHIEGGRKVKESGISLCEYVMPGLGGRKMSQEHARETARVLNEIDPDYIRLRSLHVSPTMPLWARLQDEDFELQTDDEVVEEIAVFIENLRVTGHLKSDHILNLLMEIKGKMPEDKEKCLSIINKYLSLPDEERLNFKVGRRTGLYNRLADLSDGYKHDRVEQAIRRLRAQGSNVEEEVFRLKNSFI